MKKHQYIIESKIESKDKAKEQTKDIAKIYK